MTTVQLYDFDWLPDALLILALGAFWWFMRLKSRS